MTKPLALFCPQCTEVPADADDLASHLQATHEMSEQVAQQRTREVVRECRGTQSAPPRPRAKKPKPKPAASAAASNPTPAPAPRETSSVAVCHRCKRTGGVHSPSCGTLRLCQICAKAPDGRCARHGGMGFYAARALNRRPANGTVRSMIVDLDMLIAKRDQALRALQAARKELAGAGEET